MTWLLSTLFWTGLLIAAVLTVRRPVARHFGAKAAYALWLLPLMRLALPPIVLPAWLAPAPESAVSANADTAMWIAVPVDAVPAATPAPFDWQPLLVALWGTGVAAYIAMRLMSYFRLRRDLLAGARCVGNEGRVRLLETPATSSPLAFGVLDKVVALPPGFMAWSDRRARDLALSHELAHHRAHDLAFNFLALPLFALHWFNPLSLLGWRAMRRDQEAACDARVVEHRDRIDRVAYAQLIATAAAGPRGALAAPMACPVLGDKSIVHRLRNLAMTAPSNRRRRAGALLVGASMLLVPLTASISYAQDDAPTAPEPPMPPLAPRAPDAPLAAIEPTPPLAPEAPLAADGSARTVIVDELAPENVVRGERFLIVERDKDGKHDRHAPVAGRKYKVIRIDGKDGKFDEKEFEKQMEKLDEHLSHLEGFEHRVIIPRGDIERLTRESRRLALAAPRAPVVMMRCDGDGEVSTETTDADGRKVIKICKQRIMTGALASMRAARERVASEPGMSDETRREVLQSLDREIERLEAEK